MYKDNYPLPLYGNLGSFIDRDTLSYLGSGCNGHIWKLDKDSETFAVKTFVNREFCMKYELYQKMKSLGLHRTLKAREVFKQVDSPYDMDAYMMPYLDEDRDFSLFDFPTAMLLENFSRIEQDAHMLADNHIIMCDVDVSNSIYDKLTSQLYISDIDCFYSDDTLPSFRILDRNYSLIMDLFVDYLYKDLGKSDFSSFDKTSYITQSQELFDDDFVEESPCYKIEKVFGKYQTPRQYFTKK